MPKPYNCREGFMSEPEVEYIGIKLEAMNSSGEQFLELVRQDDEFWFCLYGEYNGKEIQIDFDDMSREKLEEIKTQIEIILES